MSWKRPFPLVKLPDCQQNFDDLQGFLAGLDLKISFGKIDADGTTLIDGTGDWSVAKPSTGNYTLTFSPAFDAEPHVFLTPTPSSGALNMQVLAGSTPTASEVKVVGFLNSTDVATNTAFHFLAIGPR